MKGKVYNIVSFFIGVGTLAYMIHKIGMPLIMQNILQTGIWFVPVIGVWLVIYLLNALAFREIIYERKLPQTKVPFLTVLRITVTGYAINYITPFVALGGEPYRIMQLEKRVERSKATSSVLLYYIMHVFSHIIFWMVSIALILMFYPSMEVLISCLATLMLFGFLVYWTFKTYRKGLLITTFRALGKIGFLKKRVAGYVEKKENSLRDIDRHIIALFHFRKPTFYASLFYEFLGRLVGCLELNFIAMALHVNMSLLDAIIVSAGSSLFANLIFFTPMQLGSREGGFVLAVKSIGMAANVGMFMSLVTRIRELVWILIGLLFIPVSGPRRRVKKVRSLQKTNTV